MAITKRKLMQWRQEALKELKQQTPARFAPIKPITVANERILKLTQELIDQHLLTEAGKQIRVQRTARSKSTLLD